MCTADDHDPRTIRACEGIDPVGWSYLCSLVKGFSTMRRADKSGPIFWGVIAILVAGSATLAGVLQRGGRLMPPVKTTPEGIVFRLRDADRRKAALDRIVRPPAKVISDESADVILARVPALPKDPLDVAEFNVPVQTVPPPRPGKTIPSAFPPAPEGTKPPPPPSGPLAVRSINPSGDVGPIDRITVNFSQPIIPLSSVDTLAANIPATITPSTLGKWRWLGTQTLVFEFGSGQRLRNATEYTVTVPAGTKSITGQVLQANATSIVRTPRLTVVSSGPQGGAQALEPILYITWNQAINRAQAANFVKVSVAGVAIPVRTLTVEEASKRLGIGVNTPAALRTLWLQPVKPLATSTTVTVDVPGGATFGEGPLPSVVPHQFKFSTYGPFQFTGSRCNWSDSEPCRPDMPWQFMFTNPVDPKSVTKSKFDISPKVEMLEVYPNGNGLSLQGNFKGRTTYTVRIKDGIKDIYGQLLESTQPVVFKLVSGFPNIIGPQDPMIIADPSAPARVTFNTFNVRTFKVELYRVTPDNWNDWLLFMESNRDKTVPPGTLIQSKDIQPAGNMDRWTETGYPLAAALEGGLGNVIVRWTATLNFGTQTENRQGACWVQATRIGVSAHYDTQAMTVWASNLATGAAIANAKVRVDPSNQTGSTGKNGTLTFPLNATIGKRILVSAGGDTAFVPAALYRWQGTGFVKANYSDMPLWFSYTDRGLYRPGETVHVKGWHRIRPASQHALPIIPSSFSRIDWRLNDAQGIEVAKGDVPVNAVGGFHVSVPLPKNMNTGGAFLTWNGGGQAFNVQEFRRPEFEVIARSETQGSAILNDGGIDFSTSATYYAGGPLPGSKVLWNVSALPVSYTPPGNSEFSFGTWIPWWQSRDMMGLDMPISDTFQRGRFMGGRPGPSGTVVTHFGTTSSDGQHWVHADIDKIQPSSAVSLSATATIEDVNRQAVSSTATQLVHAANAYVGIAFPKTFVDAGQPFTVATIAVTPAGKTIPASVIRLRAFRRVWGLENGEYGNFERDVSEWTVTSGNRTETSIVPRNAGNWTLSATVKDANGRKNVSERTFWVAGDEKIVEGQKRLGLDGLTLIPSKPELFVGGTAEVLVQSPYKPTEVLIEVAALNVITSERRTLPPGGTVLRFPVTDKWLPNVHVNIYAIGSAPREGAAGGIQRPAFAHGSLNLKVSRAYKKLTVTAVANPSGVEPGGKATVSVHVKDSAGKPVQGADVSVVVVDDSVLSLSGWSLGDPLTAFYPERQSGTTALYLRSWLKLEDPLMITYAHNAMMDKSGAMRGGVAMNLAMESPAKSRKMMQEDGRVESNRPAAVADRPEGAADVGETAPIRERTNMDALAVFSPSNLSNAEGNVVVPVALPDNLTRYRVSAVAATADRFGASESQLVARLPIMARLSAPRFLNMGDTFELPVVIQNQTDQAVTVDVAVRSENATFTQGRGRRITLSANDRAEVRFPAQSSKPGIARFQVAAVAGRYADAQSVAIPVYTPASAESFATYGVVDDGVTEQAVQLPNGVRLDQGGLEITTTSTALSELTDAALYLYAYPYECAEQIASRVISTLALKDILVAFDAPGMPNAAAIKGRMDADIKRLAELQNVNGGFGFWNRGERQWPYLGVHAAHALVRARAKGVTIPDGMFNLSMAYVAAIEQHLPGEYSVSARRMIRSYALYVRGLAGQPVAEDATRLLNDIPLSELGPESVGWLLHASMGSKSSATSMAKAAALKWFETHATETAGAAHFAFSYGDNDWFVLSSNRRADAIVLDAIMLAQPKNDLIPKLVRGLLDGRRHGIWGNTQENLWSLLACESYFRTFERVTPDFVARVWLGETYAGSAAFKGRSAVRQQTTMPMSTLAKVIGKPGAIKPLIIGHEGVGRLYYRLGLKVVPESLQLPATDQGFHIQREYTGVDNPTDVTRAQSGDWVIKAGARVRITVTVVATTRRYHVAITDPLPAGLEPEFTQPSRILYPTGGWWRGWWSGWEHTNLRDERGEAFTSLLWEGAHTFTYTARATTPGTFIVPPAKAEEMYAPETFGRSAGIKVRIVE